MLYGVYTTSRMASHSVYYLNVECAQEFEYSAVNFTVTSVGVRQLCLRRIGVRSQKSLKTAVPTINFLTNILIGIFTLQPYIRSNHLTAAEC